MNTRAQAYLWFAQRASAALLGFFVLVHLVTVIYAVRNGLSAVEILGRTRGNTPWMLFYLLFVVAVAVHVPIGLRNILAETFSWRGRGLDLIVLGVGLFFLLSGLRAVWAVYAPGAA
ncbi:MAG: succinate dehydrogenase [Proteobacteria bacterium]|nr:succinate dehydrogenase [Burkholderiales bacterium]